MYIKLPDSVAVRERSLFIRLGDSEAGTPSSSANELVIEDDTTAGISILTPNNVSGYILFGDPEDLDAGQIRYAHDGTYMAFTVESNEVARLVGTNVFIGDTSNGFMTQGLTINQGASDNEILAFKSSDVAHGATDYLETDTFTRFRKSDPVGGLEVFTFLGAGATFPVAMELRAAIADTPNTTKGTTGYGVVDLRIEAISGSGVAPIPANSNLFSIRTNRGGSLDTVWLVDEDGDTWQDGKLHVQESTAGAVTANTLADDLVVETNTDNGISILTPATNTGGLYFGTVGDDDAGRILFGHSTKEMHFIAASGGAGYFKWTPGAGVEYMRLDASGTLYVGDTANADMTVGITVNQGANDNEILSLKSSDVAHGLTSYGETDTYASFRKRNAAEGGLSVRAIAEDAAVNQVLNLSSYGGTADTTKSGAGRALVEVYASEHDGANARANVTANGNVFGVQARVSGADVTLFLVDEDGDTWQQGHLAVNGVTPGSQATGYTTFANLSTDRTLDANSTTTGEIADVLGTLIEDLKATGIIGA